MNDGFIMLDWLRFGSSRRQSGQQLYAWIVAQARDPPLYQACGVPDTVEGRLEMILLHTVLVLDRLRREGPGTQRLGQRLMEHLVADVDDALRRIGLGDDSVSPRIGRLAGALAERARDYRQALEDDDSRRPASSPARPLEATLLEHVYRGSGDPCAAGRATPGVARLAGYVRELRTALAETPISDLDEGRLILPVTAAPDTSRLESRS